MQKKCIAYGVKTKVDENSQTTQRRRVVPVSMIFSNHTEGAPGPSLLGTGDSTGFADNFPSLAHNRR